MGTLTSSGRGGGERLNQNLSVYLDVYLPGGGQRGELAQKAASLMEVALLLGSPWQPMLHKQLQPWMFWGDVTVCSDQPPPSNRSRRRTKGGPTAAARQRPPYRPISRCGRGFRVGDQTSCLTFAGVGAWNQFLLVPQNPNGRNHGNRFGCFWTEIKDSSSTSVLVLF